MLAALGLGAALAALAAAVSSPPRGVVTDERAKAPGPPAAPPSTSSAVRPRTVVVTAGRRPPQRVELRRGDHAALEVRVSRPGDVDLEGLGLTQSATPAAPAMFDVLVEHPGTHAIFFRPVVGGHEPVGTLVVRG